MTAPPLLDIDRVTVWRDTTRILDDVSLQVPAGRHTVLLGPNGSGKTSLLKLLMRQFYPSITDDGQQGDVRIQGRSDWDVNQLRQQMGIVTSSLDHDFTIGRSGRMSVVQTVASGFKANRLAKYGPAMTAEVVTRIDDSIERMGLNHLRDRRVGTLSTGERRRTLIARALVHRPAILVLDEPTTGLDIASQHDLLQTLRDLSGQPGLTLFLVTHHINEILPEIDHVVLLSSGRIVAEGAKSAILTASRLRDLFETERIGASIDVESNTQGWYTAKVAESTDVTVS